MSVCYAVALGGCGGKRESREHGLSKNLLVKLTDLGTTGDLEVHAPWLPGGPRNLTEQRMFSRVLCETHNKALKPFDAEIGKLFEVLIASTRKELTTWETINGDHIERWALKVMFADVASSKVARPGTEAHKEHPPIEWLRVVFEDAPMPRGCGFHYSEKKIISKPDAHLGTFFNFAPPNDRFPGTEGALIGITIELLRFPFVTSLAPLDIAGWKASGWTVHYRPQLFTSWTEQAGIRLTWRDQPRELPPSVEG